MSVPETSAAATPVAPALLAYRFLQFGFVVAPILFGLDKFFNKLTQWPKFLAPVVANNIPIEPFIRTVGVIEVAAGLLVFFKPRIGACVVAAWLLAVIVNLLMIPGYYDIALRDLGLLLAALALASLSRMFAR
jgi:hypothetical protein